MIRSGKAIAFCLVLSAFLGCARLGYYAHLGKGGLVLVTRAEKVEKLLRDPRTPAELVSRLRLAREILEFAETQLGLPVGKKYRKYLDLERPYVVWTVVVTPEFSLEPRTWCFPIAGCVGYRGFFVPARAERLAQRFEAEGFDVSVGGVKAFSSLGWFGDPLLNTFVLDPDPEFAGLLFHELAHGLVYVKGDTAFNESFATAVERAAVLRWLKAGARAPDRQDERRQGEGRYQGERAVAEYQLAIDRFEAADAADAAFERGRERLQSAYSAWALAQGEPAGNSAVAIAAMRRRKAELFTELQHDLSAADPERQSALAGWIDRDLDNADLAAIGFYRQRLEAFEALLEAVGGDLDEFYSAARCLGALPVEARRARLETNTWGECILSRSEKPE